MARIRYSALVTEIAGSIGGSTFQRNAYGFTIKNKPNMVIPNRARQIQRKQGFAAQVQKWRRLDNEQRARWASYATTFPVPSRLNPDSILNGFNVFCRYHLFRSVNEPGVLLTEPFGIQASFSTFNVSAVVSLSEFLVQYDFVITGGNGLLSVYLTRQIPEGQTFIQDTPVFMNQDLALPPAQVNVFPFYQRIFGSVPPANSVVGLRTIFINLQAGQIIDFGQQQLLLDPI